MKRKTAILCCLLAILMCFLPVHTFAHPGRTDGKGGHTNRSTGEYHYHHGYSAHDHWDIDGDGILDCPHDFDDQTNHKSNNSGTGTNKNTQITVTDKTTHQTKRNDLRYTYIAIGFVFAFFIIVNCLAIYMDIKDKSQTEEPTSITSVFISVCSTIIVFAILFYFMYLFKDKIQFRAISSGEVFQVLLSSAIISGIVWIAANSASLFINSLLCSLFKVEVHGWAGSFQRLTVPLSYAFTVFFFILK